MGVDERNFIKDYIFHYKAWITLFYPHLIGEDERIYTREQKRIIQGLEAFKSRIINV